MKFLIRDRLGRLRFFGLEPGEARRRVFRERLTRAIFQRRALSCARCFPRGGSDCGLVSAPGQRLREEEKQAVKRGRVQPKISGLTHRARPNGSLSHWIVSSAM